jgi:hypothetical protein
MTLAAVDRIVHHAVILEMNVESYTQRAAAKRQKQHTASDSKRDTKKCSSQCLPRDAPGDTSLVAPRHLRHRPLTQ